MDKFDVVVIGGGLGGLTCGAMLAKEGLGVCVLEQHGVIGGCLQSFMRNGCILDTGMHYVGCLSDGEIMNQYLKYLGIMDDLKLQKLDEDGFDYFHFSDGSVFCHAVGYDNFIDKLSANFPDDRKGLLSFCNTVRNIGNLISPEILESGRISGSGVEYMSMSAYREIERNIKNDTLRRVLAGNCGLYAGDRLATSMYEYGMITHSNIQGPYAFVDGSQQMADLLSDRIKSDGGVIRLKTKAKSIDLNGDRVGCVTLESGEKIEAKWVVSSIHPAVTFSLLDNNTVYKKAFFTRINSLPDSYGLFTTYLLLKHNSVRYINQNHYLFNNPDVWAVSGDYKGFNIPSVLLCMQPNSESEYTKVITLLTPMPLSACDRWSDSYVGHRDESYVEFKHRFSEAVIDFVSRFYPGLPSCIDKVYTATPLTYRDYTSTPQGSAYGIVKDCRNPMVTIMPAKTRIANLLLSGQSLNIHGCIGTTVSSAVTCSEILGMEYLAKKIGNA